MQSSHVFTAQIGAVQWHPNGRWLAITDFSGAVHLMDPISGAVRLLGRHRAESVTATFDSSGDYLITGGWERSFVCWDVRTMERAFGIELDSYVTRFQAAGSGLAVVTASAVELHTFERPEVVRELAMKSSSRLYHAAFSPDGRLLTVSSAGGLNVWDVTGGDAGVTDDEAAEIRPFWSGDGTELFGSSSRAGAHRWQVLPATASDGTPGLQRLPLRRAAGDESLCAVSNLVAWTGTRGTFTTPGADPAEADQWFRTARGINGLSPDGHWLGIYGPGTPALHVYRVPDMVRVTLVTNRARITGFTFSPSGRELAVVSRGHLEIRSTATWEHLRGMTNVVGISYVGTLYQPDERALWLASSQRTAGLHDAQNFELLLPLPAGMMPMALSADGRQLAVSVDARRLQLWDLGSVRTRLREIGLDWADSRP